MDDYLAHSAGEDYPAQSYLAHVEAVTRRAEDNAQRADAFSNAPGQLTNVARQSAEYHDLGKLDAENQAELHRADSKRHLPINHVDAGAAFLLEKAPFSSFAVYSHHKGLPNYTEEYIREQAIFRDENKDIRNRIDLELPELVKLHRQLFHSTFSHKAETFSGDQSVFLRLALSCLADADHTDTAISKKKYPNEIDYPALRPSERLDALNRYVASLSSSGARSELRSRMYQVCAYAEIRESIVSCSSPVGTGKTTAVMAHLLHCAAQRGSRHILVVLPYTNIITQSVDVYRKALVLPGENPQTVVAELHHKADFENEDVRYLNALWRSPIIVTTAAAFFETLASNKPAALRRLHELPGSVIFVDEAHAALPAHLLKTTWQWMQTYADEWKCHWVLASGSLVKFWDMPGIGEGKRAVPELVPADLRGQLDGFEASRVTYQYLPAPLSRDELVETVLAEPGPRLLIMNTVQSAAVLASDIKERYGRNCVEHLSTSLTPIDREKTIKQIKQRLENEEDTNWVLVATSCVEAGVDISFRSGFRELSSLVSLLQTAGRVNRGGSQSDAKVFSFTMQEDSYLKPNPGVQAAAKILERYFQKGREIVPSLSTDALQRELSEYGNPDRSKALYDNETNMNFAKVASDYQVIESNTVLAVVNPDIANQLRFGGFDWQSLQKNSVSVNKWNVQKWHMQEIKPGIYQWTLPYSPFLGYMEGVIAQINVKEGFLWI